MKVSSCLNEFLLRHTQGRVPRPAGGFTVQTCFERMATEGKIANVAQFAPFKPVQRLQMHDVRIHDLRHSYASTLVNNGATLYEVQKLLGHSKSQTTERYAHLANHTLIRAASLIDKAFSK